MFLSPSELSSHMYEGVMDAISENDDTKVMTAINAAISEAKGYLSRYDTTALFDLEAEARDPILLLYIKDMAVWHFIALANPNIDYEARQNRYEAAILWFGKIQAGRVVPAGWPYASEATEKQTYFLFGSNPRRNSHY